MAHDKAYTFVAALLRRSKNRTATNLDHYAKRSDLGDRGSEAPDYTQIATNNGDRIGVDATAINR